MERIAIYILCKYNKKAGFRYFRDSVFFIKPKYIFMYLYTINHRNGGKYMDTEKVLKMISEAKSVGIMLESDMQMNKQDQNIINVVKVINNLLGMALDNFSKDK